MKTSTKVVIKFQIFTSIILFFVLFFIDIALLKFGLQQYEAKIARIKHSFSYNTNSGFGKGKYRSWQKLNGNCFMMYNQKFCLNNSLGFGLYQVDDYFFYVKDGVVFDVTDFVNFYVFLLKISIGVWFAYLFLSYFFGKVFLQSIYKRIFKAVQDLQEKNYIEVERMNLEYGDELRILFDTINNQIDTISSFNKYLSHELKTPLMKILSALDLINLKCKDSRIPELKKELFFIKDIIDSLNKLVLIETKNYKIKKEPFDICNYIQAYSNILNLRVSIFCQTTKKEFLTSKELFSLVLKNILENAKKYSDGEVKVTISDKFISFENKANKIKDVSKLTERFYKESNKGLGIGLYLVKKICQILDYKLEISYVDGVFKIMIVF